MAFKVFVDSDVIISSLISSTGAAYLLLNKTDNLDLLVSNISIQELEIVTQRLGLQKEKLKRLIDKTFTVIHLKKSAKELQTAFTDYVTDIHDAHIVAGAASDAAGAKVGNSKFLLSYNTKHFNAEKLKEDFNIILTTPASFLQYLRSIS